MINGFSSPSRVFFFSSWYSEKDDPRLGCARSPHSEPSPSSPLCWFGVGGSLILAFMILYAGSGKFGLVLHFLFAGLWIIVHSSATWGSHFASHILMTSAGELGGGGVVPMQL